MKHFLPALRLKIFLTVLLGLFYPLAMTVVSQGIFPHQAKGNLELIAQKFEKPQYFWPRPSAVDFNPLPSGAANLGQASADLKKAFDDRKTKVMAANPGAGEPPQELLFASASGLDPDISPETAEYQAPRVALARHMDLAKMKELIAQNTKPRQLGFLGEPTINVLQLNIALDKIKDEK